MRAVYTTEGRLRPRRTGHGAEDAILRACPGAVAAPNYEQGPHLDPILGSYHRIETAWASDRWYGFVAPPGAF